VAPERFYLHPSASRDLREATKRYRERDKDIAADFVKAVDDAIATIVAAPQRWPVKTRWRRYYLKRDGSRFGITANDGALVEVDVCRATLEAARVVVQQVIDAFKWTGPPAHLP
jgi:hypothetical protein